MLVSPNWKGIRPFLKETGVWSNYFPKIGNNWEHDGATGIVTSSTQIGTINTDVDYVAGHKVLQRANAQLSHETTVAGKRVDLKPDALFGLDYSGKTRLYCVELDRGTEQVEGIIKGKKTHERNVEQYKQYIADGGYKDHLGLQGTDVGMMVIYVTTNMDRMYHMAKVADNNYSLFACVPQFGYFFSPVKPIIDLFLSPYYRRNRDSFHINTLDGKAPRGTV